MDIYPQDLGPLGQPVLQARMQYSQARRDPRMPAWARAGIGVGSLGAVVSSYAFLFLTTGSTGWLCLLASGVGVFGAALWGRARSLRRPLTVNEVQDLQADVVDPLMRSYLNLALAAINTQPPEEEAQASVREAIRALGGSLAGLPQPVGKVTWDDPKVFQAQAEQLTLEATAEADAVIGASLRRRAEALHRQVETEAWTNTLLRRNDALREEVADQIGALQTSLTALRVGGTQAVYELAGVAASIQQVAVEAGALTQARSEVGDAVTAQALGIKNV